jgi:rSAM/selenodomain-associated transferase 1
VSDRTLVVFVKEPRPGAVKTRLAAVLGPDDAARLYRALAGAVLEATVPEPGEYERLVFYDPPDAGERLRAWLPSGRLRRQDPGHLGARMSGAFARCFARGASRVVLAGSDAPGLGRRHVTAALDRLDAHDVVLGPAHDGGYYLVALRAAQPSLFEEVSWSTASVLEDTLARARAAGLRVALLERLRDVDTCDDLRAEWPTVGPMLDRDPALRERTARALGLAAGGGTTA